MAIANEEYCDNYRAKIEGKLETSFNKIEKQYKVVHKILEQVIQYKKQPKLNLKQLNNQPNSLLKKQALHFQDETENTKQKLNLYTLLNGLKDN